MYKTERIIVCENGVFYIGDIITIKFNNGGGCGSCRIEKITNSGFHFTQGTSRIKSVQYSEIAELNLHGNKIKENKEN